MNDKQKIDEIREYIKCIRIAWFSRQHQRPISPCDMILAARDDQIGVLLTALDEARRENERLQGAAKWALGLNNELQKECASLRRQNERLKASIDRMADSLAGNRQYLHGDAVEDLRALLINPLTAEEEETDECRHPCQPDDPCTECAEYWLRMVQDGYWDEELGQWSDKGWREIMKW